MEYSKLRYKFPMMLQLHADGGDPDTGGDQGGSGGDPGGNDGGGKKPLEELLKDYTIEELLAYKPIQSATDKRVTDGINTAKTRWQAEREAETDEAAKLAKMTETQKERYQLDKDRAAFEAQKSAFARQQLILQAKATLQSKGLPAEFGDLLKGSTAEEIAAEIATLEATMGTYRQSVLNGAMRGTPPTDPKPTGAKLTAEEIRKMTPDEINKAWADGRIDTSKL